MSRRPPTASFDVTGAPVNQSYRGLPAGPPGPLKRKATQTGAAVAFAPLRRGPRMPSSSLRQAQSSRASRPRVVCSVPPSRSCTCLTESPPKTRERLVCRLLEPCYGDSWRRLGRDCQGRPSVSLYICRYAADPLPARSGPARCGAGRPESDGRGPAGPGLVELAWRGDGDAVDAEYAAEKVEVPVVVQDGESAFGGGRGDQVVRCWQAAFDGEFA